jgi:hypothetical protein
VLLPAPVFAMVDFMQVVSHQHYLGAGDADFPLFYQDFFESLQVG